MSRNFILAIVVLYAIIGCRNLIYKNDTSKPSGFAKSAEAMVKINDKLCESMGDIGTCYVNIKRGKDIIFDLPAMPYNYNFKLLCTDSLNINKDIIVMKDAEQSILIPGYRIEKIQIPLCSGQLIDVDVFNCDGLIFPVERDQIQVHKMFSVRFMVYDKDYEPLPEMTIGEFGGKKYLILGEHALYGEITNDGKVKKINKQTFIEIKKDETNIKAWSCSSMERCNYYNYSE